MPHVDPEEHRRYQRERPKRLREAWLAEHGPCVKCGSAERLEVDHIDPATKVSHRIWSWSAKRREEELSKCQVLCHSCHQEKTSEWRAQTPILHGTDGGYTGRECRCPECTEAHRVTKQAWREARRAGLPAS